MGDLELRAFEIEFSRPISKRERVMVGIVGKVFLGNFTRPGWSGDIEFYLFKCKIHGLVTSYVRGRRSLTCPSCKKTEYTEQDTAICQEELNTLRRELRSMEKQ